MNQSIELLLLEASNPATSPERLRQLCERMETARGAFPDQAGHRSQFQLTWTRNGSIGSFAQASQALPLLRFIQIHAADQLRRIWLQLGNQLLEPVIRNRSPSSKQRIRPPTLEGLAAPSRAARSLRRSPRFRRRNSNSGATWPRCEWNGFIDRLDGVLAHQPLGVPGLTTLPSRSGRQVGDR